jgi:phosphopantothenoylcysteine synthetase/decarboxylase
MSDNAGPKVLLGASGSIAILDLHSYLLQLRSYAEAFALILTDAAARMVQPKVLEAVSGARIFRDPFDCPIQVPHINLSLWADVFVVIPATANVLGKAANGIADDLLTTTILAWGSPVFFVPAMNERMWRNPAVEYNLERLKLFGHEIVLGKSHRAQEASSHRVVETALMPSPSELIVRIRELINSPIVGERLKSRKMT